MQRHRFDALSFIFGALFVTVAGIALLGPDLVNLQDLRWVAPALLVLAGAVLLLSTARGDDADLDEAADARDDAADASTAAGAEQEEGASAAPAMGQTDDGR